MGLHAAGQPDPHQPRPRGRRSEGRGLPKAISKGELLVDAPADWGWMDEWMDISVLVLVKERADDVLLGAFDSPRTTQPPACLPNGPNQRRAECQLRSMGVLNGCRTYFSEPNPQIMHLATFFCRSSRIG